MILSVTFCFRLWFGTEFGVESEGLSRLGFSCITGSMCYFEVVTGKSSRHLTCLVSQKNVFMMNPWENWEPLVYAWTW